MPVYRKYIVSHGHLTVNPGSSHFTRFAYDITLVLQQLVMLINFFLV